MSLSNRLNSVRDRIEKASNTANSEVQLLAVSKKHLVEKIKQLYECENQRLFGESYVQEAVEKIQQLSALDIEWHFIGPLQSNKTKLVAEHFNWVQSIDSIKLLTRLNRQRLATQQPLNVLLQLKVGGEASKRGFDEKSLLKVCQQYAHFPRLKIRGLMSIPAPTSNDQEQLEQFQVCQKVYQKMRSIIDVDTLSIGMSSDLEAAIASGSTMVRVGTDIFGSRDY